MGGSLSNSGGGGSGAGASTPTTPIERQEQYEETEQGPAGEDEDDEEVVAQVRTVATVASAAAPPARIPQPLPGQVQSGRWYSPRKGGTTPGGGSSSIDEEAESARVLTLGPRGPPQPAAVSSTVSSSGSSVGPVASAWSSQSTLSTMTLESPQAKRSSASASTSSTAGRGIMPYMRSQSSTSTAAPPPHSRNSSMVVTDTIPEHEVDTDTADAEDNAAADEESEVFRTPYLSDDLDLSLKYLNYIRQAFDETRSNKNGSGKQSVRQRLQFIETLLKSQPLLELMSRHDEKLVFQRSVSGIYEMDRELADFLSSQYSPMNSLQEIVHAPVSLAGAAAGIRFAMSLNRMVLDNDFQWGQLRAATSLNAQAVLEPFLATFHTWEFDIWALDGATDGHAFACVAFLLFREYGLLGEDRLHQHKVIPFFMKTQSMYQYVVIVANVHAADVAQTVHAFLRANLNADLKLRSTDQFAVLLASLIHDLAHPGLNNNFLVTTSHPLAIRYNDEGVLENYHVSEAFRIMHEDAACNIFTCIPAAEHKATRQLIIQCVIGTDMAYHFDHFADFKAQVLAPLRDQALVVDDCKRFILKFAVHCADVSNPAKPAGVYMPWAQLVMEEFYAQGDEERRRGLPLSPFMDRNNPQQAKCQLGFMDFIVLPLYSAWGELVSKLGPSFTKYLTANQQTWQERLSGKSCTPLPGPRPLPAAIPVSGSHAPRRPSIMTAAGATADEV